MPVYRIDWKGGQWSVWDEEGDTIYTANEVDVQCPCRLVNEESSQGEFRGVLKIETDNIVREKNKLTIR